MTATLTQLEPQAFALAGNAIFTIENTATGNRFTYKVRRAPETHDPQGKLLPDPPVYFVSYLRGPDNTSNYSYIGLIGKDLIFRRTHRSKVTFKAQCFQVFEWLWNAHLRGGRLLPEPVKFHHAGRCGRCGRLLTTPESVERGFGPECWAVMSLGGPR